MKSFKIERIHSTAMYEKNICGTRSKFLVLRQIGKLFEIQQSYPIEMDSCYYYNCWLLRHNFLIPKKTIEKGLKSQQFF